MDKKRLTNDVRHLLDEQELKSGVVFEDEDALPIEDRIEALFAGAWNTTMRLMPPRLMTRKSVTKAALTADLQCGTGRVTLPADYLCMVEFRMKGWKRSVDHTIPEDSGEYLLQQNAAMRGGCVRPVVALVGGGREIEYYSLPRWYEKHEIEKFDYCPRAGSVEDTETNEGAYKVLTLMLAHDVAVSMGRDTKGIDERLKQELSIYGDEMQ